MILDQIWMGVIERWGRVIKKCEQVCSINFAIHHNHKIEKEASIKEGFIKNMNFLAPPHLQGFDYLEQVKLYKCSLRIFLFKLRPLLSNESI